MAYVFHDAGDAAGTVESRFFFPSGPAVLEDPATGSACANLGGWFGVIRPQVDIARVVSQGEAVQRPSTLYLDVKHDDGKVSEERVEMTAPGVLKMKGIDQSLLKFGDVVTFEAWPSKNPGDNAPNGRTLILSDGRRFDVGDTWGLGVKPR